METLTALFIIGSIVGIGIIIWFRTKSGKKWLKDF